MDILFITVVVIRLWMLINQRGDEVRNQLFLKTFGFEYDNLRGITRESYKKLIKEQIQSLKSEVNEARDSLQKAETREEIDSCARGVKDAMRKWEAARWLLIDNGEWGKEMELQEKPAPTTKVLATSRETEKVAEVTKEIRDDRPIISLPLTTGKKNEKEMKRPVLISALVPAILFALLGFLVVSKDSGSGAGLFVGVGLCFGALVYFSTSAYFGARAFPRCPSLGAIVGVIMMSSPGSYFLKYFGYSFGYSKISDNLGWISFTTCCLFLVLCLMLTPTRKTLEQQQSTR